jgi:phenylalanyl-tRNA synthetase beta chain
VLGRAIRGVKNGPSPQWLQDRLTAIGLRPINALVDITNLLSYDRARPLHVFDATKVTGNLVVRMGQEGERLTALDGKDYALRPADCVIADDTGVVSIAGIMGGASTGCDETTTDVLVESALWTPLNMFQTGRATGINSDARYRFERGVDPAFMVPGLDLATALILELCGGEASQRVVAGSVPQGRGPVNFALSETRRLTGMDVSEDETVRILTTLGFAPQKTGEGRYAVGVPSWRHDVDGPADLVEDIARIAGFGRLPMETLPPSAHSGPVSTPAQNRVRTARRTLAAQGWHEAVTWSFAARATCELFGAPQGGGPLVLANPIAAELDCMRPSALIHLILAAQRNADRGFGAVSLFEAGPVYQDDTPGGQQTVLAGVTRGALRHWSGTQAPDVHSVRDQVLSVLAALGIAPTSVQVVQGARDWWHPGRSGQIRMGPKLVLAEFGELHPRVLKAMDVDAGLIGFELFLDALPQPKAKAGKNKGSLKASSQMPFTRDFAFLVAASEPAGDLVRTVANADKALVSGVRLFDRYDGQGVPDGQVSLGLEVTIQPGGETLTDEAIEALTARIVKAAAKHGAVLRG